MWVLFRYSDFNIYTQSLWKIQGSLSYTEEHPKFFLFGVPEWIAGKHEVSGKRGYIKTN